MKPSVVFDIDGVVAEFCWAFTSVAAELGIVKRPWSTAEQKTWKFDFHVDPVWQEIDRIDCFWTSLAPINLGATLDALYKLDERANIIYATGRQGSSAAAQTVQWLKNWRFPQGLLFMAEPKTDKLPILVPHKHQIIGVIDDKPDVVTALRQNGIPVTVRAWQYNRHLDGPRVGSVAEFVEKLLDSPPLWEPQRATSSSSVSA